ncbi:hypothetical protein GCM10011378_13490 [Hymenobacter glacieicola]|uniref:Uncharacterized protein n=1 Tax=Hymenobacter glacieicola TaxID=1562124 RepID=A0ABQ1WQN6_9BACT|nr:hypothetical protein GCM10011378_13490 [Hymenobacter glacieicola]
MSSKREKWQEADIRKGKTSCESRHVKLEPAYSILATYFNLLELVMAQQGFQVVIIGVGQGPVHLGVGGFVGHAVPDKDVVSCWAWGRKPTAKTSNRAARQRQRKVERSMVVGLRQSSGLRLLLWSKVSAHAPKAAEAYPALRASTSSMRPYSLASSARSQ